MPRPERNGDCKHCDSRVRYYPPEGLVVDGAAPAGGYWAHLGNGWLKAPHQPEPTDETLVAAGLSLTRGTRG